MTVIKMPKQSNGTVQNLTVVSCFLNADSHD